MKNKVVTVILSIILFIVPVLILPEIWGPYNVLKIILLLSCGAILLFITLMRGKDLKFDKLDICGLIFVILAILSTIFSTNITKSILGEYNRFEGVFTIITYFLIYYNAKYYFKDYKYFIPIGLCIFISICILSIVQFYLYYSIILIPIFAKGANGTFGNVNFMGSFISLILPAFIFGYVVKGKKTYLLFATAGFCSLILCVTRSAWVAFIIYFLLILFYLLKTKEKACFKRVFILIAIFILVFFILYLTDFHKLISSKILSMSNETKNMIENGVNEQNGSGRIAIWKITSKIIFHSPILGCGVDCIRDGLAKICTNEYIEYVMLFKSNIDKAHNEYLQIAATMGIPALAIYLIFVSSILVFNFKKAFKDEKTALYLIMIFSYLVQAFFNISTIGVAPIFWFILGLASRDIKIE